MLAAVRRTVTALTVAGVLLVASADPATADLGGRVDCTKTPDDPSCVLVVLDPGHGGQGGSSGGSITCTQGGQVVPCNDPDFGWLGSDGCRYKVDSQPPAWVTVPAGADPSQGTFYVRTCPKTGGRDETIDTVWLPFRNAPVLGSLLTQAMSELHLPRPTIRANPDPGVSQVVFVPTWLWVDSAVWHSYSATVTIPGMSLTAVGQPVSVVWQTGDGASVTCGQGTAWVAGTDPSAGSPDCGHTYTSSSTAQPSGGFTLRATITWKVTWSGGGAAGVEPALTSTNSVLVRVVESSVVNTN